MAIQGEFFERPVVAVSISEDSETEVHLLNGSERMARRKHPNPVVQETLAAETPAPTKRAMKDLSIPKLYYSISEVSRLTALEPYVLRYWETEFEELRPQKNRAGNRIYSNRDIKFILRIKALLREQRYTIEGAKVILRNDRISESKSQDETASTNDPAQITLATDKPAAPQATLTLEEVRSMKEALGELRSIFGRA